MFSEYEITSEKIDKFLAIHGQKGVKTLSLLGKIAPLKIALESEVGKEILSDAMTHMEILLEKIVLDKASKKQKIEYRVLRRIFNTWVSKIAKFEEKQKQIKETTV